MNRWFLAIIVVTLVGMLVGCGKSKNVGPTGSTGATHVIGPPLSPAECEGNGPPCSAITQEGARGKNKTRLVPEPTLTTPAPKSPPQLTGNAIQLDTAGTQFVAQFENVYQRIYCPYWDPYGRVWSRAFGETDWSDTFGHRCITYNQAIGNLRYLMDTHYLPAVRELHTSYNHHQISALASFVWNLGPGSMRWPSLRYGLQHYNPYPMLAYDRAGGVVLGALVRRRHAEVAKFLQPEAPPPRPSRHQLEAKLRSHQHKLNRYRAQINHLRTKIRRHGCAQLRHENKRLGPKCKGWFAAGDRVHRRINQEKRIITKLKREIAKS